MNDVRYDMSLYRIIIFTTKYREFKKWLDWSKADRHPITILITKRKRGNQYGLIIYRCQKDMLKYMVQENLI